MKFSVYAQLVIIPSILVFLDSTFVSSQDENVTQSRCADCRQYNIEKSKRETGFWCESQEDADRIKRIRGGTKNELSTCISKPFAMLTEIFDFCCFWGPELACGQLVGKHQLEKWAGTFPATCNECKKYCFPEAKPQSCADCKLFNQKWIKGKVEETGFYCRSPEDAAKVSIGPRKKEFEFRNVCVPNQFAIEGEVHDFCCFWSPKMGCGQLVGKVMKNSCNACHNHCPNASFKHSELRPYFILKILLLSISCVSII